MGSAYGYRALARLRRHNWVGAFLDGRRSNEHLNKALQRDPRLYDTYFALGAYHYWRTARSGFIRAVAFWMRDRRELGKHQMQLAIDHGRYIRNGALHGLALAQYDAGETAQALRTNTVVLGAIEPPTNGSLYLRGRLLAQQQDWPAVESTFHQLLAKLTEKSVGYQVECKYWIARALVEQEQPESALQLTKQALEQSRARDADLELESALEGFEVVLDRLVELQKDLSSLSGR